MPLCKWAGFLEQNQKSQTKACETPGLTTLRLIKLQQCFLSFKNAQSFEEQFFVKPL